ncbi:MAG: hypothetical protein QW191_06305 [Conexivisphaerales archaeon]
MLKELKVLCEPDKIVFRITQVRSSGIELYWAYRMLSERHEVVKPIADKSNS